MSTSSTLCVVMATTAALLLTTLCIGVSRAQNDVTASSSGPTHFFSWTSDTARSLPHTNIGVNMTSSQDQRQMVDGLSSANTSLSSYQLAVNKIQSTTSASLPDMTTTNLLVQPTAGVSRQLTSDNSRQKPLEGVYGYLDDFTAEDNGWESDQPSDDNNSDDDDETDSDDDDSEDYDTHDVMNANDIISQYNYNNMPSSFDDDEANRRYYGNYSVVGGSSSNTDDSLRRLMTSSSLNSRSEPINISLLVIYSWLGLVVIMVIITIITYRYKEPLNDAWTTVWSFVCCGRSKRSRGIEESNTLLTHPLV